jgi:MATE family multidrug resistance protein
VAVAAWAPFGSALFGLFGTDPEVARLAAGYFGWRVVAAPALFVGVALAGWLSGQGDTRSVMLAALLGNAVNIALDAALVPVFGMEGAGMASAVAQVTGAVTLAVACRRLLARPRWPRRADALAILRVRLPIGANNGLDVGSYTVFALMLASAGEAQLAAHVVAVRILSVSFMPGYAIGEAGGVLVGQAMGAGRPADARRAFRSAATLAVGMMLCFGVAFAAFPETWLAPFRVALDVEVVAVRVLLLAAAIQVFDAVATCALLALNGAGDTRFTLGVTVGAAWLVKLPIASFLVCWLGWGAVGAWAGLACEIAVLAAVLLTRLRGDRWLR